MKKLVQIYPLTLPRERTEWWARRSPIGVTPLEPDVGDLISSFVAVRFTKKEGSGAQREHRRVHRLRTAMR